MAQIVVRVDDTLKDEAMNLYRELGIDLTTAVKMFLTKSVRTQSIPFDLVLEEKKYSVTNEQFNRMVEASREGKKIDLNNPADIEEVFGDEDFSDYERIFNERI